MPEKQYERVNEPMLEKLYRVADNYEKGKVSCPDRHYIANALRESARRIEANRKTAVR